MGGREDAVGTQPEASPRAAEGHWPGGVTPFGEPLRETREARGLSLEAVADATRIAQRHLASLEQGDVEALPAGPFAKGYIETYARLLHIDPGPILEAYRAEGRRRGLDTAEAQDRIIEEYSQIVEHRAGMTQRVGWLRPGRALAVVLVVAGLLGGGGWLLQHLRGQESAEPAAPRVASAPPAERDVSEAWPRGARTPPTPPPPPTESPSPAEVAPASAADGVPPASSAVDPQPARPAPLAAAGALEVSHSGVGTGVENSRLVGRGDRFPEGRRVVFWTRVLGGRPGEVIHHVWFHEGQQVTLAELTLGGSHWRTYSTRVLEPGQTGRWVVEARRPDGEVLARQEFLCVPEER